MSDFYDKRLIWSFDDLSQAEQKEASEKGFEAGKRYIKDGDYDEVAICPYCHKSTITVEEWVALCPHFVFLESCYNGYEFILPDFAKFVMTDVAKTLLGYDEDQIADFIADGSIPLQHR